MKNKYKQHFYCWGNRESFFFAIVILLFFSPQLCLSQIFVSKDATLFDAENLIKTDNNSKQEKSDVYIVEGTATSGLENQSVVVVYIDNPETEVLLRSVHNDAKSYAEKKHGSKNTKKEISGRTETPKQKTLVYKPLYPENQFYFSSIKSNSAVSAGSGSSLKKSGAFFGTALAKFQTLNGFSRSGKFDTENEKFTTYLISYKSGRAPPSSS